MFKGQVADQHGVEHDAAAPQVHPQRIVGLLAEHFWGGVAGTSAGSGEPFLRLVEVAESEIDEFDGVVVGDEYVFWFDVAVGDA